MNAFSKWFPILSRAFLYFFIAALPVLLGEIQEFADGKATPNGWKLAWIVGSAVFSGLVALRAYFDTSVKRHADDLAEKAGPMVLAMLLLSGCATTSEQRSLLNASGFVVEAVDAAMYSWSGYTSANLVSSKDINDVKEAYTIYYEASVAEKAAWIAWVKTQDGYNDVERARAIVAAVKGPLLKLITRLATREHSVLTLDPDQPPPDKLTIQAVEVAFASLRPYSEYRIRE